MIRIGSPGFQSMPATSIAATLFFLTKWKYKPSLDLQNHFASQVNITDTDIQTPFITTPTQNGPWVFEMHLVLFA